MATQNHMSYDDYPTPGSASDNNHSSNTNLDDGFSSDNGLRYLIVRPDKGVIWDIFRYMVLGDIASGMRFLESNCENEEGTDSMVGRVAADHRSGILVVVIVRKIVAVIAKPMEWTGYFVDFLLNLLCENGYFFGLMYNLFLGKVVVPQRDTESFLSLTGHLDGRVDLCKDQSFADGNDTNSVSDGGSLKVEMGNWALMDLCIMACKLAYENAQVIRSAVLHLWKMHFVDFYTCWKDYQKKWSTQVFILCDKPKDANLILITFRGAEIFEPTGWSTDFDYSWYEVPKFGRVHMGFLEALGLGSRTDPTTFHYHLQVKDRERGSSELMSSYTDSDIDQGGEVKVMSAYDTLRSKLQILLEEHKNAKFLVTGHGLGGALAILFPVVLVLQEENEVMQRFLGV
ncbi:Lipase [Quillaja saponaria]|uniref:Lipase n=1 Tax=Quillaja saponaria TaxID=32244 RepID=A0AAD7LSM1_QUISA|nr:Lipase [Quillaja saponaria]